MAPHHPRTLRRGFHSRALLVPLPCLCPRQASRHCLASSPQEGWTVLSMALLSTERIPVAYCSSKQFLFSVLASGWLGISSTTTRQSNLLRGSHPLDGRHGCATQHKAQLLLMDGCLRST
ncbi:hypothetical protein BS78_05G025700 [Paspalum vaginatum]|nr:hypothetical protein BS78_05G025700 [Paspalum vaginatum]